MRVLGHEPETSSSINQVNWNGISPSKVTTLYLKEHEFSVHQYVFAVSMQDWQTHDYNQAILSTTVCQLPNILFIRWLSNGCVIIHLQHSSYCLLGRFCGGSCHCNICHMRCNSSELSYTSILFSKCTCPFITQPPAQKIEKADHLKFASWTVKHQQTSEWVRPVTAL